MREELGLTQPELAALFPPTSRGERTANWISSIETDKQRVRVEEIPLFAQALGVTVGWLVMGEASGDSEFIARIKGMELRLDRRARNAVLKIAQQQIEDTE